MTHAKDAVMDDTRLAAASEWFLRLREATVTNDVITAWLQWCNDDPENARAFREIQEIWSLAKDAGVSEWPTATQTRDDRYQGEIQVAEWLQQQAQRDLPRLVPRTSSRRWRAYALAASLVLALGAAGLARYWSTQLSADVYATERAARREVLLNDGSAVSLGGASTIRVMYQPDQRDIELKSGEAHFKVRPDKSRPFIVRAGDVRVRAVGTAFTVRADDERTIVLVTEGVVEITEPDARWNSAIQPLRASAGEQVTIDAQRGSATRQPSDSSVALGWQDGALSYVDEPLRSVIARVNRNSTTEIVLTDPAIGELRFTGTVHENQIPEWAFGLERVFPVRVVAHADGHIALGSR
jgi:transmembrane sensor